jgi:hypothetical protein
MKRFFLLIFVALFMFMDTGCVYRRNFYTNGNTIYSPLERCRPSDALNGESFVYDNVTLTNGTAPNEFIINGFGGFGNLSVNITAHITGKNTFIVPFQTQANWGLSVEGQENTTGTLNRKTHKITLPYKVIFADNTIEICTLELTRQ